MANETVVLELDSAEQEKLRREVDRAGYELRTVDHAHFSARADGLTATLYRSGKLVVQGAGARLFVERHLDRGSQPQVRERSPKRSRRPGHPHDRRR